MKYNLIEGKLEFDNVKIAIIVSRFNSFITERLLEGALDQFSRLGLNIDKNVFVYKVPGSFEIPMLLSRLINKDYSGILCLGAVIRGETPHFDYVAAEVSKGIANISLNTDIPITYGILTTDNIEQAIERAGTKSGNKGGEGALSLTEMISLYKNI